MKPLRQAIRLLVLALLFVTAALPSPVGALPIDGSESPQLEARIIALTNAERGRLGLQPLVADAALTQAARAHSVEMIRLDYFAHESPTPALRTPSLRAARAGCTDVEVGENIAFFQGWNVEEAARRVVADWMASPGHRANLLRPSYTAIGIGLAWGGDKITISQELSGHYVVIEPLELTMSGDSRTVRLRGHVLTTAREIAIFADGQCPQRLGVDRAGGFSTVLRLRGGGPPSLRIGLPSERGHDGTGYRIVSVVPLRTEPVTAR